MTIKKLVASTLIFCVCLSISVSASGSIINKNSYKIINKPSAESSIFDMITKKDGNFAVSGLEWGISEKELMNRLDLSESDVSRGNSVQMIPSMITSKKTNYIMKEFSDYGLQISYVFNDADEFCGINCGVFFNAKPTWDGDSMGLALTDMDPKVAIKKSREITEIFTKNFGDPRLVGDIDSLVSPEGRFLAQWFGDEEGGLGITFHHQVNEFYNGRTVFGFDILATGPIN